MDTKFRLWALVCLILVFISCSEKTPLGTQKNPIKIYFTPSVDAEKIATNSKEFIRFLEEDTGYFFKTGIPTSFVAVVEAIGSERADIAVMNSFGYLMANERYGAEAKLTVLRHGIMTYRGQIITHVDSGINTIEDLEGKSFAFVDPSSVTGRLSALKVLAEKGVKLGNTTYSMKHDNVVTQVYQRQADAGATFHAYPDENGKERDARSRVLTQFPDVMEKVKILAITQDVRNDPFVFRKDLPAEMTNKVLAAIEKYLSTEEGKTSFKNIYDVEGVVRTQDSDYDELRKIVKAANISLEELL
jgi:phosphonate transport system substrate-binding protein